LRMAFDSIHVDLDRKWALRAWAWIAAASPLSARSGG
jgi:hypothetical protein